MAIDEAMLDRAELEKQATVRTYEWAEPTLSLGYFQRIAEAVADERFRDRPIVRRPTGGGAIWHDGDLTYALAIPASHPLAKRHVELYEVVHEAIAGALQALGAPARRRGEPIVPSLPETTQTAIRPFLCFTDRDPADIVILEHKIVGGAQRRRRGAVLQHGSLLLRRSPQVPESPGLADLTPLSDRASQWSGIVIDRIVSALGLVSRPIEIEARFNALDPARIAERARDVYLDPVWTRRR